MEHPCYELIRAILFEQKMFPVLDASEFGIYSAFCTHTDFPAALRQESTQRQLLELHFDFYRPDYYGDAPLSNITEPLVNAALKVQDHLFPKRVWEPDMALDLDAAVPALREAVARLNDYQCTQFVLMNGMHEGSLFPALAAITGCISFEEYKEIATAHCQPDSHHEQWVRSTASYIELFGQLTG